PLPQLSFHAFHFCPPQAFLLVVLLVDEGINFFLLFIRDVVAYVRILQDLIGIEPPGGRRDDHSRLRRTFRRDRDGLLIGGPDVGMPDHHLIGAGRHIAEDEPTVLVRLREVWIHYR